MKLIIAFVAGFIIPTSLATLAFAEESRGNAVQIETLKIQHEATSLFSGASGTGKTFKN